MHAVAHPHPTGWNRLQADPSLLHRAPALVAEFEVAPWLLPPRTNLLPYAAVHGFEQLLALRALPEGGQNSTVTVLLFSRKWAPMLQNSSECGAAMYHAWVEPM